MRLSRSITGAPRHAGLATVVAAVALLVVASAPASAASTPAQQDSAPAALQATADRLTDELGSRAAGALVDSAGHLVINVVDTAAAARLAEAGVRANVVKHSTAQLEAVKAELDRMGGPAQTGWAVDVTANAVVVTVSTAGGAAITAFVEKLRPFGDMVRVERVAAPLSTQAFYGGQAIYGAGGGRCSSAFNARNSAGVYYVITAGHCTRAISSWSTGSQTIGPSAGASFPGNDYGRIRVTNPTALDPRPAIRSSGGIQTITSVSQVPVGSRVCKTGSTTGTTCGTVQQYNATVNYAEGTVTGLIRTNLCTQPGDSGGGLFAGSAAQGIVSGGTVGGCGTAGFRSYFQPVGEALSAYGLTLL